MNNKDDTLSIILMVKGEKSLTYKKVEDMNTGLVEGCMKDINFLLKFQQACYTY
jgi:hypothetical protein